MRSGLALALVVAVAGCRFDLPATADAAVDTAGSIDAPALACYGAPTGLVKPCFEAAPTEDIVLPTTIDTDTSPLCKSPFSGGDGYCVIAGTRIRAENSVAVSGSKPLVLVAATFIDIDSGTTLDAASHNSSIPPKTGPGSNSPDCTTGTLPQTAGGGGGAGGGGAGGSFGSSGGSGGSGSGTAAAAGIPGVLQMAATLRGGCPGQNGADGSFGMGGRGGRGGGAIYLIAGMTITIAGVINASGEGGHPGTDGGGGGGGAGAGGMIGLDAPTINNTGEVFANGASGGEGAGQNTPGRIGPEPIDADPSPTATGGTGNGGDGGTGSGLGATTGGTGSNGNIPPNAGGGGGGGGGLGVIKVYRTTITGAGRVSPPPS